MKDDENFVQWDTLFGIVYEIFRVRGVSKVSSHSVAEALLMAESSGAYGHGLSRVAIYAAQVDSGRIHREASPTAEEITPVMYRIDAGRGFAYPCIDLAIEKLDSVVKNYGLGIVGIYNSNHFGQAGWHCERLARKGITALMFGNTGGAMSLLGGKKRLLGTNPIAFSTPNPKASDPLVIDVSLSKVARGKILRAKQEGTEIPEGWALDKKGKPTRDIAQALDGFMMPMGGHKGVALASMVELLSLAVGGSLSHDVSNPLSSDGDEPALGQCLIGFDANKLSAGTHEQKIARFLSLSEQDKNARIPGTKRLQARAIVQEKGFLIKKETLENLTLLTRPPL